MLARAIGPKVTLLYADEFYEVEISQEFAKAVLEQLETDITDLVTITPGTERRVLWASGCDLPRWRIGGQNWCW